MYHQTGFKTFLRMAAKDSSVVLMDEPFSAVDVKSRGSLQNYLLAGKAMQGKLFICVTHDLGEALYHYDEVLLMKNGTIAAHDGFERLKQTGEYAAFRAEEGCGVTPCGRYYHDKRMNEQRVASIYQKYEDKTRTESEGIMFAAACVLCRRLR